ncbi:MAG TPA: alpha/beta fold hydrolase [Candidatus Acidoferrales bacterium]|nr:alpha/beta fold hydrolase [Candidatus Acidoferrales bacterium]
MAVLSEFRYLISRIAKVLSGILALLLFGFVTIATVSGYLLYQILHPPRNAATFDLNVMMGHPSTFSFDIPGASTREGWLFPGLRGAPTIVVCHGYSSQRGEVLTLVTALQDHQFNVFLFDFMGHGTSPGTTTLGYHETAELRSAIQALSTRDDVDPQHFGLWGVDMGGYAALEVAAADPRITALAVDDAYDDPRSLVRMEVQKSGLTALPFVLRLSDFGFRMANYPFRDEPPVSTRLARTRGVPKLFVQSEDRPALANETFQLFIKAPDPKSTLRETQSYRDMSDDDRKTYESQIVNFFLQSMPPTAGH